MRSLAREVTGLWLTRREEQGYPLGVVPALADPPAAKPAAERSAEAGEQLATRRAGKAQRCRARGTLGGAVPQARALLWPAGMPSRTAATATRVPATEPVAPSFRSARVFAAPFVLEVGSEELPPEDVVAALEQLK